MTEESTGQTSLPSQPTSDDLRLELFAFPCGHGDTILLHLFDKDQHKWVLVDCYLPTQAGVREGFFKFLDAKKVRRLDVIVQTHPDRDHFHGMFDVVERFTATGGRSIGIYYDCGVDAKLVQQWAAQAAEEKSAEPRERAYVQLKERLAELKQAGTLEWKQIDADRPPVPLRGFGGNVELVPIAPDPDFSLLWSMRDVRRVIMSPGSRPVTNRMSLVLVLCVRTSTRQFEVLLGADADRDNIHRGLDCWKDYAAAKGLAEPFDVVKVPHHGSLESHSDRLCPMRNPARESVAVFSVGRRRVLPDRAVLQAYKDQGWRTLATTTRHDPGEPARPAAARGRPRDRAFTLADRSSRVWRRHLVTLSWSSSADKIDGGPPEAEIARVDLPHYETAGE